MRGPRVETGPFDLDDAEPAVTKISDF